MNSLVSLSTFGAGGKTGGGSSSSNVTVSISILPANTSYTCSINTFDIGMFTGVFSKNEIGATYLNGNVSLPAGNYIIQNYFTLTSDSTYNNRGSPLQYGSFKNSSNWYNWDTWRFWPTANAWSSMIGISLTDAMSASDRQVRNFSQINSGTMKYANGNLRIIQITSPNGPSGYTANANGTFSISSGWNLQTMGVTYLTAIPGLSYSAGTFSIPPGTFVISAYYYAGSGSNPWAYGFQTSTSAVAPTNLLNPPLDAWCYSKNCGTYPSDTVTRVYKFSSNNNFRIYTYSSAGTTLNQAKVLITQVA